MTPPKVSVLVPNYNLGRYLPEAIESILEQDYPNFEVLISDDCSQDDSAEIIERYASNDPRIRVQIHPSNKGMVENWNWCLRQAQGEYIKFVFGDDKLASPAALTKMVQMLENNDGVTLAVSARFIIDENSKILRLRNNLGELQIHPGADLIIRCLEENINLIGEPSVVLFRKRDAGRGFNGRYRQLPDLEMWFHLLEKGNLAFTPEPLCAFRKHPLQQTELNRPARVHQIEHLIMLAEYYARPWVQSHAAPDLLFGHVCKFRKQPKLPDHDASSLEIDRAFSAVLGPGWYTRLRWRARLAPLSKLTRWFRKNRAD